MKITWKAYTIIMQHRLLDISKFIHFFCFWNFQIQSDYIITIVLSLVTRKIPISLLKFRARSSKNSHNNPMTMKNCKMYLRDNRLEKKYWLFNFELIKEILISNKLRKFPNLSHKFKITQFTSNLIKEKLTLQYLQSSLAPPTWRTTISYSILGSTIFT